jgi:hypothetical protein
VKAVGAHTGNAQIERELCRSFHVSIVLG